MNRVIEGGHEPRRFATDMLDRFRDLIVLASVPDAISSGLLDVPPDRADALRGQAERYGLASLTRAADIVAAGLDQMRGATSPRLLLELMCAQVLLPAAASDERSVLARLERLEAGAAAASAGVQAAQAVQRPPPAEHGSGRARASPAGSRRAARSGRRTCRPPPAAQPPAAQPPATGPSATAHPQPRDPHHGPLASGAPGRAALGWAALAQRSRSRRRPAPAAAGVRASSPVAAARRPQRPAPAFTHAPGSAGAPAAPAEPRGPVTVDVLRQAWPGVVEGIKAKGGSPRS